MINQMGSTVLSIEAISLDRQIVSSLDPIGRNYRLDPSQYNKSADKAIRHLKQLGCDLITIRNLQEYKEVYLPNRFSRTYLNDADYGLPMLGTSTMFMSRLPNDLRIKIDDNVSESELLIRTGDILISRSGTIGTIVLCGESYKKFAASDDCFRLRIDSAISGFVYIYLKSTLGKTLLERDAHGKVIRHLKESDLLNNVIPIINSSIIKRINNLVHQSVASVDKARKLFDEADEKLTLFFETNQEDIKSTEYLKKSENSFLNSSYDINNNRLDPHYYFPKVENIRRRLEKFTHKDLGEIADIWGVPRFKRLRADYGYGTALYSSGDIMRAILIPSAYLSSSRNSKQISKCIVKEGTILIPCSGAFGGILGRCVKANNTLDGNAVTQHVVRITVKDPEFKPDYVSAILSSPRYGYQMITAARFGKDVPEIDPKDLRTIPIPKLDEDKQSSISKNINEAYQFLDTANELENLAQSELLSALKWTG